MLNALDLDPRQVRRGLRQLVQALNDGADGFAVITVPTESGNLVLGIEAIVKDSGQSLIFVSSCLFGPSTLAFRAEGDQTKALRTVQNPYTQRQWGFDPVTLYMTEACQIPANSRIAIEFEAA